MAGERSEAAEESQAVEYRIFGPGSFALKLGIEAYLGLPENNGSLGRFGSAPEKDQDEAYYTMGKTCIIKVAPALPDRVRIQGSKSERGEAEQLLIKISREQVGRGMRLEKIEAK